MRLLILLCLLLIIITYANATNVELTPVELSPELLSAGGAYISIEKGLPALFSNPAILARIPGTVSYFNQTAWMHNELQHIVPTLFDLFSGSQGYISTDPGLEPLLEKSGFGFGGSIVSGYYGNNFAVALALANDLLLYGNEYPERLYGLFNTDLRLIISLAYPFTIGIVDIAVGFSIEPFYRIHSELNSAETLDLLMRYFNVGGSGASSFLHGENTLYGGGVAVHPGILVVIDDLVSIGFTVRDIGGTRINYSRTSLQNVLYRLERFSLPAEALPGEEGYLSGVTHTLPTRFRLGVAYHPLIPELPRVRPRFSVEVNESIFEEINLPDYNVFHSLHLGVSLTIDNWLETRLGLNQGQFTIGTGFDFGVFELETAWFGKMNNFPEKRFSSHGLIISIHFDHETELSDVQSSRSPGTRR